jgi:hypothetical protein
MASCSPERTPPAAARFRATPVYAPTSRKADLRLRPRCRPARVAANVQACPNTSFTTSIIRPSAASRLSPSEVTQAHCVTKRRSPRVSSAATPSGGSSGHRPPVTRSSFCPLRRPRALDSSRGSRRPDSVSPESGGARVEHEPPRWTSHPVKCSRPNVCARTVATISSGQRDLGRCAGGRWKRGLGAPRRAALGQVTAAGPARFRSPARRLWLCRRATHASVAEASSRPRADASRPRTGNRGKRCVRARSARGGLRSVRGQRGRACRVCRGCWCGGFRQF